MNMAVFGAICISIAIPTVMLLSIYLTGVVVSRAQAKMQTIVFESREVLNSALADLTTAEIFYTEMPESSSQQESLSRESHGLAVTHVVWISKDDLAQTLALFNGHYAIGHSENSILVSSIERVAREDV